MAIPAFLGRKAAGRSETGNPLRYYALDPWFHCVPAATAHPIPMLMVPM
jgi:hypothetical protein